MRLVCHHTFCIYPSNWYLRFCRTSLVSAGKCDILTDRDILGGRTPPYLCSRPCLPSFREIVRAVLEKNAEMTDIEGKRQGRSNLGCNALTCHAGYQRTLNALNMRVFWPSLKHDVKAVIEACPECQRFKVGRRQPQGRYTHTQTPLQPGTELGSILLAQIAVVAHDRIGCVVFFSPPTIPLIID